MRLNNEGCYISDLLPGPGICHGFGTLQFDFEKMVTEKVLTVPKTKQVHGNRVHYLSDIDESRVYEGDAFITQEKSVAIFVRTADCLPLILVDKEKSVVAAVHAGWKGIDKGVVGAVVGGMLDLGSDPKSIKAAIGPRIRKNCYQFGDEYYSLSCAVMGQLCDAGVKKDNIDVIQKCTFCDSDEFYSYRRDKKHEGRQISFIYQVT